MEDIILIMNLKIKDYYNNLASNYDDNRFGNSYGKYIDLQERKLLFNFFKKNTFNKILDAGCGTGRLLEFASHGIDLSENMVFESKKKHIEKDIKVGSLTNIPFGNNYFNAVFSFHVIMHLDQEVTTTFLNESHRVLETKGTLIFDFPSKKRRLLTQHKSENWHAANHFSIKEILELTQKEWNIKKYRGVLFFPIHRVPTPFRPLFFKLDNLLCKSFLREYASYIILELEKK